MPVIKLKNVQKSYLDQPILQPLNLTLPAQQITAITGPASASKATLLNVIAGYQQPDTGRIYFDQRLVFNETHHFSLQPRDRQVAMLCLDFAFWPHLTVRENIAFPLRNMLTGQALITRVNRALVQLELTELQDRYPGDLSQLQKQHLALARILAQQPAVLIFDESWSLGKTDLAQQLRTTVATVARRLALTTVMVTEDDQAATHLADYLVELQHGQIVKTQAAKKLVLTTN